MEGNNQQSPAPGAQKLRINKIVEGDIVCLRFNGTVDEDFDGKKMAQGVKGTLVVDLGQVRRISSFGIREWVDFINTAGERCRAIYFVECTPKIIDQFNMVANFGGSGRILSFYAPYRCDFCDDDRRRLVQMEEDWEAIQNFHLPDHPCDSCGNPEYFDEDPQSFFTNLAAQPKIEPDPAVANFLATKLKYSVSDAARRLRLDKHIGKATYIKISGDMESNFPKEKVAEGLEGDVVFDVGAIGRIDREGAAVWVKTMYEIAPLTKRILVHRATPGFIERLSSKQALAGKVQVLDFYMPFQCPGCGTTAAQPVNVAEHHDVLKFATAPEIVCPDCGSTTTCVASDEFLTAVSGLPVPESDADLRQFMEEAEEAVNRPPPGAAAQSAAPSLPSADKVGAGAVAAPVRAVGLATLVAVAVSLVAAGAAGFIVWQYLKKSDRAVYDEEGRVAKQKAVKVPPWMAKARTARVWRDGSRVNIVGYSFSVRDSGDARQRAMDHALDLVVHEIATGIQDETWKGAVLKQYKGERDAALERFKKALSEKDGAAVRRSRKALWSARRRVARAFKATAYEFPKEGDDFWQKLRTRDGTRWKYWVVYTLDETRLERYRKHYTGTYEVQGVKVGNYFPGLAWVYPTVKAAAVVLEVQPQSAWRVPGLDVGNLVVDCKRRRVRGGKEFVEAVQELTESMKHTGGRLECKALYGSTVRPVGYAIPKTATRRGSSGRRRPSGRREPRDPWKEPWE